MDGLILICCLLQDVWVAYHKDRAAVSKYLAPLLVGELKENKEVSSSF